MATKRTQDIDLGIVRYEYGDAQRPQRAVLTIETDKSGRGGIESIATVMWCGDHSRQHMFGLAGGGDFSIRVFQTLKTMRATQKAINFIHAGAFTPEKIAELIEQAKAHYAGHIAAGVDGFKNTYPSAASAAVTAPATHVLCSEDGEGGEHLTVHATDEQLRMMGLYPVGSTYDDVLPTWQGSTISIEAAYAKYPAVTA